MLGNRTPMDSTYLIEGQILIEIGNIYMLDSRAPK